MAQPRIVIRPYPRYVADTQDPYQFHYLIEIENLGPGPAQLLHRRWLITDSNGKMLEVEGPGVVGEQPLIAEGETFSYQSGVPLATPLGVMEGSYTLQDESGQRFEAPIAPFTLGSVDVSSRPRRSQFFRGARRETRSLVVQMSRRVTTLRAKTDPSLWVARQMMPCVVAGLVKGVTIASVPRLAWRHLSQQRGLRRNVNRP